MQPLLNIAAALDDPTRLRTLCALRGGELCLCHLIALLGLAPSTVSKHLDLLVRAGLVLRRKEGRWAYFRLAGRAAPAPVRQALRWALSSLRDDAAIARDAARLLDLRKCDPTELSTCYRS